MSWLVAFDERFLDETDEFPVEVRIELAAMIRLLERFGPTLKRPHCDTLKASRHSNMKELRFDAANGVWRVAFAFDPERNAFLLVAGDKAGVSKTRFYKSLIATADSRFDDHLATPERQPIMTKTAQDFFDRLPPELREAAEIRAGTLIAEELTLRDLRQAHALTQTRMAELLGIQQENVSRLERRSDLLLSTLKSYVAAMGGSLKLIAGFPDRPPVTLSYADLSDGDDRKARIRAG